MGVLAGSPGTGKTWVTAQLVKTLLQRGIHPQRIAIGTPTGKAGVRFSEALQEIGVKIKAVTWHSLLGIGEPDKVSGGWGFKHGKSNPWPYDVVIGDEISMVDLSLMRSVFDARPRGCHVLLVGDINQLSPVGAGAPLRDIIASGIVGYGELTEIHRSSGGIVEACADIRDGRPWKEAENLKVTPAKNAPLDRIFESLEQARKDELDRVWDCQVLVAVNDKSPVSRRIVNKKLQDALNPNTANKGTPFRLADKIVCLKNGRFTLVHKYGTSWVTVNTGGEYRRGYYDESDCFHFDDDGETLVDDSNRSYAANGELARIIDIQPSTVLAELSSPKRIVRIPLGKASEDSEAGGAGCDWDLAYALSVHKSQGSEWPRVVVVIDEHAGAKRLCDRSWLYTAISRAKQLCELVGRKSTADAMCMKLAIKQRKTLLRQRLQLAYMERTMVEL